MRFTAGTVVEDGFGSGAVFRVSGPPTRGRYPLEPVSAEAHERAARHRALHRRYEVLIGSQWLHEHRNQAGGRA